MRTLILFPVLIIASLPLQAAPPSTTSASGPAHPASVPAPRSPIGEVMGDLTRALREAAAQQGHAQSSSDALHAQAPTAQPPTRDAVSPLPPDATAQAAVP